MTLPNPSYPMGREAVYPRVLPEGWTPLASITINRTAPQWVMPSCFRTGLYPDDYQLIDIDFTYYTNLGRGNYTVMHVENDHYYANLLALNVQQSDRPLFFSAMLNRDTQACTRADVRINAHAPRVRAVVTQSPAEASVHLSEAATMEQRLSALTSPKEQLGTQEYYIGAFIKNGSHYLANHGAMAIYSIKARCGDNSIDCVPALSPDGVPELYDFVSGAALVREGPVPEYQL